MIQSARGKNLHIRYEDGKYSCPHCWRNYTDGNEREKRIMKNKRGYTWRQCVCCLNRFGICSNPMSGIRGFDLNEVI